MNPTINGNTLPDESLTCLTAVWLNFPPVQQMLDQLRSNPPPSAALETPYVLQALLWGSRGIIQESAIRAKIFNGRWFFPPKQDPAETHEALIDSCLKNCGAASTAETLADHESIWYNIAEIFPSQRTVLPLGTSGDGDDLQQLIDNNSHMIPTGTPKLQILELGRRGYDEEKRAWYKNCRSVTIPDKVIIDSTKYILYALITHTGDFRSQKYYAYVRPGGVDGRWAYYRKNMALPVDHGRATIQNQGTGVVKYQSGPVAMHTNEVAYIFYYAREDVFAHDPRAMDNGASRAGPKALPDWIAQLKATPGQTISAAVSANAAVRYQLDHDDDDEDDSEGSDEDDGSNDDDGDEDGDEVMRDRADDEEGSHAPVHTSQPLPFESVVSYTGTPKSSSSGSMSVTGMHIDSRPRQTTRDFLGSDYYQGTTVEGRPHGTGTLISIGTGDKYSGGFEDGAKSGYGTMIFANGDVYKGNWSSDQQNGHGMFTEALTGNKYTGGWQDGRQHGEGTTYWKKAQDDKRGCRLCWSNDVQIVFIRCGHICACESCAARCDTCPVCREVVRGRQKFYFSN
ncbi:hypothetical protein MBLNU457_1703t1 [Dothideomycetes sp. NU457]